MPDRLIYRETFFYNNILEGTPRRIVDEAAAHATQSYTAFQIEKRSGGMRDILAIDKDSDLYRLQRLLKKNLFDQCMLPLCVKGFAPECSYKHYLSPHIGARYFLHVDIRDFFPSITYELLHRHLQRLVRIQDEDEQQRVVLLITALCTAEVNTAGSFALPQGAVTSPSVSNFVMRRLDRRIEKYCACYDVRYTRYADDMMFSSHTYDFRQKVNIYTKVRRILASEGFALNSKKTKLAEEEMSIGGFVVGERLRLSKTKRRDISFLFYCWQRYMKWVYKAEGQSNPQYQFFITFVDYEQRCIEEGRQAHFDTAAYKSMLSGRGPWAKRLPNAMAMVHYLAGYRAFVIDWLTLGSEKVETEELQKLLVKIEALLNWLTDTVATGGSPAV